MGLRKSEVFNMALDLNGQPKKAKGISEQEAARLVSEWLHRILAQLWQVTAYQLFF